VAHAWSLSGFVTLAIGGTCMAIVYPALLVATGQLRVNAPVLGEKTWNSISRS
jgi:hypothetical protein